MTVTPDAGWSIEVVAGDLARGIVAALPGWVERSVERLVLAWTQEEPTAAVRAAATNAGRQAQEDLGPKITELLTADIDEQRTTPLALLRDAVRYPTAVLRDAGVPPVERDRFAADAFPDDDYDLTPATFADLDPALADPGLAWGAAKAMAHRIRHGDHR